MTKPEFQQKRTKIISDMLDNPNEIGIYPTSKCYYDLDALYDSILIDLFALDTPLPTKEAISRLLWASEYLLHEKGYDGGNYEEIEGAVKVAKNLIAKIDSLHKYICSNSDNKLCESERVWTPMEEKTPEDGARVYCLLDCNDIAVATYHAGTNNFSCPYWKKEWKVIGWRIYN